MSNIQQTNKLAPTNRKKVAIQFYVDVLKILIDADLPFMVGGTQAYECYTGVRRETKDLDLFVCRHHLGKILGYLKYKGYKTELTFQHWLAKVYKGHLFVDIIFASANGTCPVSDEWFKYAGTSQVYGLTVKLIPIEEMICSKAYIMEKERFDGADINHLIRCQGKSIDWNRLLKIFGDHWRVLFSHIVMYGFVYPEEKDRVPNWLIEELASRLLKEQSQSSGNLDKCSSTDSIGFTSSDVRSERICNGTLVSRAQYLTDVYKWGYGDGRLGKMSDEDIYQWTKAMPDLSKYCKKLIICKRTTNTSKKDQEDSVDIKSVLLDAVEDGASPFPPIPVPGHDPASELVN